MQGEVAQSSRSKWYVLGPLHLHLRARSLRISSCDVSDRSCIVFSVNKAPFTPEEDALICAMYKQIGSKWAEMAKMMPGRPDNAIKNHFNTSLQRSKRRNAAAAAASASAVATSGQTRSPLRSPPTSIITDRRYSPYGPPSSSSKPPSPSALSSASSTSSHTRKPMAPPSVARDLNKEYFNSVFAGNGWTPPTPDESPNGRMVGMSVPGSDGVGDFPFGCYVSQAQHYSLPNLKAVLAHVDQGGHTTMPGNVPSHSHFSLQNLDARGNLPPSPGSPPVNPLPKQYSAAPTSQAGPLPPLRSFSGSSVSAGMIPRMPQMPMHSTYSYPVMRRDVYPESGIVDDRLEMDMAGVALVQRG